MLAQETPVKRSLLGSVPLVDTLADYRRSFLRPDVVTGLVLATMLVPQGLAYAELTGLPAVTGIYTTIAALVAYAVFGPNRRLVLGPDSSLAPVIAAVVVPLAAGDDGAAVAIASAMSLLAGVICVLSGVFRLGVVTELLSKPIRVGYLNGIAVLILVSQIPKALGFSTDSESPFGLIGEIFTDIANGDINGNALLISALGIGLILFLNRISRLRPGVIVAAVVSILVVALVDLSVDLVGSIPAGLPPLTIPTAGLGLLPALLGGAFAVALVSFADTGALSTATSLKVGEKVDPNSEIKALGAANLVSGMFQGFATSASSSRTAVAMAVGNKTQLAGLIAAAGVVVIMFFGSDLIAMMPQATLAAIVITASFTLFDFATWKWLWQVRRSEFALSAVTALAVLGVGVLEGIGIAVLLSLANFIRKGWRPHSTELGKIEGVAGFHDVTRNPEAKLTDGLLIMRYDAPLFFANAPDFARRLNDLLATAGRPIHRVLIVGNAITDIDSTGAEVLGEVLDRFDERDIDLCFGGLKGPVKDRLRSYGMMERIGVDSFYPNTIAAVEAHTESRSRSERNPK